MIKLNVPYNHKGGIIAADTRLQLPSEVEADLVKNENAEYYVPDTIVEKNEENNSLKELTKAELIEHASKIGIKDISGTITKAEIIARIEEYGKL